MDKTEKRWTKVARNILLNRTITGVRYMNKEEANVFGWYKRPLVFHLDNGIGITVSQDDEGNDGGALFTTDKQENCLPVI